MAGTSAAHRAKRKLAYKMLTRAERAAGVSPFQGFQWGLRKFARKIRTNIVLKEQFDSRRKQYIAALKKAEKNHGKASKKATHA